MKKLLFFILFLFAPNLLLAQSKPTDYSDINNWESIFFGTTGDYSFHPKTIVEADNNWQLLLAMKEGLALEQLDSLRIPYTHSQLLLLRSQRMLDRNQNRYNTNFPILCNEQTISLRRYSKAVANEIYMQIEKECNALIVYLSENNMAENAFSILFSYILDGLFWERLKNEEVVVYEERQDIWSGYYWVLTPARAFQCGTNSLATDDNEFEFSVTWSDIEKFTWRLYDNDFGALFQSLADGVSDNEVIDEFSPFGFFDIHSTLAIPVIDEKEQNILCTLSGNIIDKLLPAFMGATDLETLKKSFMFSDNSETVVIFFHEVMWDILDLLLQKQVIELPIIFQSPDKARLTDVAYLCYIVIR